MANKANLVPMVCLVALFAGLLQAATASAAPPPNHMTLAEACALPNTRCFPLPSGAGTGATPTQAGETASAGARAGSRKPQPRPASGRYAARGMRTRRCQVLPLTFRLSSVGHAGGDA